MLENKKAGKQHQGDPLFEDLRARGIVWAVLHLRCPRCHHGHVFSGLFTMRKRCNVCGMVFERESGYFIGAMYISYIFATIILSLFIVFAYQLLPELGDMSVFGIALLLFLPLVPFVFRYSRVIWMAFDRAFDPKG